MVRHSPIRVVLAHDLAHQRPFVPALGWADVARRGPVLLRGHATEQVVPGSGLRRPDRHGGWPTLSHPDEALVLRVAHARFMSVGLLLNFQLLTVNSQTTVVASLPTPPVISASSPAILLDTMITL